MKLLIAAGADLNTSNSSGNTALQVAAAEGREGVVKLLLQAGASTEAGWLLGRNALLCAAASNKDTTSCGKVLIGAGADVNKCASDGNTALHLACGRGKDGFVELLIQAGADMNQQNKKGHSPLYEAVVNGHMGCVHVLMGAGATQNDLRMIPLCELVHSKNANLSCVNLLIEAGADVERCNVVGFTSLHKAALYGHVDCLTALIRSGAEVNKRTNAGDTALHLAGKANCMTSLIAAGAEVSTANKAGCTPLEVAAKNRNNECLKILLENGGQGSVAVVSYEDAMSLFHSSLKSGQDVEHLVLAGVDVIRKNAEGKNSLEICLSSPENEEGRKHTAEILWAAGALLNRMKVHPQYSQFVELLFRAGQDERPYNVFSLKKQIQMRLRCHLLQVNKKGNLFTCVPSLGLQPDLQSYLLFGVELNNSLKVKGYQVVLEVKKEQEKKLQETLKREQRRFFEQEQRFWREHAMQMQNLILMQQQTQIWLNRH